MAAVMEFSRFNYETILKTGMEEQGKGYVHELEIKHDHLCECCEWRSVTL